ncbi:Hypothetical predicted protein [Lecanosticta acicola]|uniref:Uncharacterized protein n=1 Tax=Lecanosticta acicola TaxID=111012 RepID=A0AAI8YWY3_9PEZI|nr:Hypothetical predicted protein [Lecanosticta acicola]
MQATQAPHAPQESQASEASKDPKGSERAQVPEEEDPSSSSSSSSSEDEDEDPRDYNTSIGSAIPVGFRLPNCVVSAVELLTYFPYHLQWPDIVFRLWRAGFRSPTMAKTQLYARGTLNKTELKRRHDAIRQQIKTAGKGPSWFGPAFNGATNAPYKDDPRLQPISAADYPRTECPNGVMEHYDVSDAQTPQTSTFRQKPDPATLSQVANGVIHHPQGLEAGIVTKVMLFAAARDWVDPATGRQWTTDDIPALAFRLGFGLPQEAYTDTWDQLCLESCEAIDRPTA